MNDAKQKGEIIVDFHAHIYPAKIADKASHTIGEFYNTSMRFNGSSEKLLESGREIGVKYYIVHSTATKPEQVEAINNYIIGETQLHPEYIGFGTIHPDYENFEEELHRIKRSQAPPRLSKIHGGYSENGSNIRSDSKIGNAGIGSCGGLPLRLLRPEKNPKCVKKTP